MLRPVVSRRGAITRLLLAWGNPVNPLQTDPAAITSAWVDGIMPFHTWAVGVPQRNKHEQAI